MGDKLLKILVAGPVRAGKTTIANVLAGVDENPNITEKYNPTQGVRIMEFEVDIPSTKRARVELEMWDTSGDPKFESCWPAIVRDAQGVVFVFNPEESSHEKDLHFWYARFVAPARLKDSQCCVVASLLDDEPVRKLKMASQPPTHHPPTDSLHSVAKPFSRMPLTVLSLNDEQDVQRLRTDFANFVANVVDAL